MRKHPAVQSAEEPTQYRKDLETDRHADATVRKRQCHTYICIREKDAMGTLGKEAVPKKNSMHKY